MTAVAARKLMPDPTPHDWSQWIAASEAARLLGMHEGHLRRICGEQLHASGMAIYAAPLGGNKARWWISRKYDVRLTGGITSERHQVTNLDQFSRAQVDTAWARAACVDRLREARQTMPGLMRDWLPALLAELRKAHPKLKISRGTLFRWDAAYKAPADLDKLIDQRGGDTRSKGDPAAWKFFESIFLDDREPALIECWQRTREAAAHDHWRWCSVHSCRRQLDKRIPPERQMRFRQPKKWRQTMAPYIEQHPEAWAAGECWIGDHKQLDFCCLSGQRLVYPWLTVWKDWRTRRVTGWVLSESPSSATILAALRHGLLDPANMGGPSAVHIDNGRDYDCYTFHGQTKSERLRKIKLSLNEDQATGLFRLLGIEAHFSLAFNPNGKSRLERWFRNSDALSSSFPTYRGQASTRKPESLAKILKERKLIPTFAHVHQRVANWIVGENARTNHAIDDLVDSDTGERLSADQAMARWRTNQRVLAEPGVLDLLMQQWHKPVTMSRNGLSITIAGQTLTYGATDPALMRFKAPRKEDRPQLFVSYDDRDITRVRVFDDRYRFVCETMRNDLADWHDATPQSRQHLAGAMKKKAEYAKAIKVEREHYQAEYLTTAELIGEEARRQQREEQPTQVQAEGFKLVQTPLDQAVKHVETRRAAGAEMSGSGRAQPAARNDAALASPAALMRQLGSFPLPAADDDDMELQPLRLGMYDHAADAPLTDDEPDDRKSPWLQTQEAGDE